MESHIVDFSSIGEAYKISDTRDTFGHEREMFFRIAGFPPALSGVRTGGPRTHQIVSLKIPRKLTECRTLTNSQTFLDWKMG